MGKTPDFLKLEPVRVSPLIKTVRWTLLILGIWYGSSRRRFLKEREIPIRQEEERLKKIRDAQLAEERRLASDRDIEYLADIFLGKSSG